ncbi:MAG: hypothetical protein ACBR14_12435 [Microcoleus sp.]
MVCNWFGRSDTTVKTSPNDVLAALRTSLNTSGSAIGTLRFSNPGGSGGHSVAPIGIKEEEFMTEDVGDNLPIT